MSELRRRGGEGKGAEGGDGDASGHPAQRAATWPSPLSQCCLCNTMLVNIEHKSINIRKNSPLSSNVTKMCVFLA